MTDLANAETEPRQGLRFSMNIGLADDSESTLVQMKRRREAARRLAPLSTGYRDPHFDVRPTNGATL